MIKEKWQPLFLHNEIVVLLVLVWILRLDMNIKKDMRSSGVPYKLSSFIFDFFFPLQFYSLYFKIFYFNFFSSIMQSGRLNYPIELNWT